MIQFKYYNEGATFDASSLNNDDIAFVEDENALYTHGKKFKFVEEPEVTPDASADPTPISQYGFYREVQLAPSLLAKVLVDKYGRLIVDIHDEVTWALVWNEESGVIDVNSEGRYNVQLETWLNNYGQSDFAFVDEGGSYIYTLTNGTDSEQLEFDDELDTFNPVPREFSTGVPSMYYRLIHYNEFNPIVICNHEGKLIDFDAVGNHIYGYVRKQENRIELDFNTIADGQGAIEACGGTVNGNFYPSEGEINNFVLEYDNALISADVNAVIVSGELTQWNG